MLNRNGYRNRDKYLLNSQNRMLSSKIPSSLNDSSHSHHDSNSSRSHLDSNLSRAETLSSNNSNSKHFRIRSRPTSSPLHGPSSCRQLLLGRSSLRVLLVLPAVQRRYPGILESSVVRESRTGSSPQEDSSNKIIRRDKLYRRRKSSWNKRGSGTSC